MGAARVLLWMLGCLLVVGGLVMLYFQSPLNRYVSMTMASIGLMIVVGLMVMGASGAAKPAPRVVVNQNRVVKPVETYRTSYGATQSPAPAPVVPLAPAANRPSLASEVGNAEFTGVTQTQAVRPDGAVVRSTVERVVAKSPSGARRTYVRKTKTVTKRPSAKRQNGQKKRSHRAQRETIKSR